jgi:hypothetical protein
MQRLNIPLSSHRRTTRRNRRVVWVLGALIPLSLFILWRMSVLWFERTTIFDAAPDNTVLAVQLIINEKTIEEQMGLFDQIPLVSNRSLTVDDLLPNTDGELAWFFDASGTRTVAVRTKTDFPERFMRNYGLIAKRISSDLILLSETLVPIGGVDHYPRALFFPRPSKHLGQVLLTDTGVSGNIFAEDGNFVIEFGYGIAGLSPLRILENTVVSLSTPKWPKYSSDEITKLIDRVLANGNETVIKGITSLFLANISYLMTSTDTQNSYVLQGEVQDSLDISKLVQELASQNNPTVEKVLLADHTTMTILRSEPEFISVEEISQDGNTVLRSKDIYAQKTGNLLNLSNNQELLLDWVSDDEPVAKKSCPSNFLYLNPEKFIQQIQLESISGSVGMLSQLLGRFSQVSVETQKGSTQIQFCR